MAPLSPQKITKAATARQTSGVNICWAKTTPAKTKRFLTHWRGRSDVRTAASILSRPTGGSHAAGHRAARSASVELGGEGDEAGLVAHHARPPREVVGIAGQAVAADAGAGLEGHEAEGLGRRGIDDLPDGEPEPPAHDGQLVHEGDV